MDGLMLTRETLIGMSESTRNEIIAAVLGDEISQAIATAMSGESEEGPIDLDPPLLKKFMSGVGSKIKDGLEEIAKRNGRAKMSHVVRKLKVDDWSELRGFQSGITRRVRNITGDSDAYLLWWDEDTAIYEDEMLVDGEWFVSRTTLASLRAHFDMKG